jgi:MscS family membrane protein
MLMKTQSLSTVGCFGLFLACCLSLDAGVSAERTSHWLPAPPVVLTAMPPQKQRHKPAPPPAAAAPIPVPAPVAVAPPPQPPPVDPLGRGTPHGTVLGFLHAADRGDYGAAQEYLDSKKPPEEAERLASQLKVLLDRGLSTSIDDISRQPEGNLEDQLRVSRERVGFVTTPAGRVEILLDLVQRPEKQSIWLFSSETLDRVPAAFASIQQPELERKLPAWSTGIHLFGVPLWRWGAILIWIALGLGFAAAIARALGLLFQAIFKDRFPLGAHEVVLALQAPVFWVILACILLASASNALTALARHYWRSTGTFLLLTGATWLLLRVIDLFGAFAAHRFSSRLQVERTTVVTLAQRFLKVGTVLLLIVLLLKQAGVNVSALLAGLGIGGIALALAAQRTLADLFGGLVVVMRGAVRVGDFCQIDGQKGTVEDIGFSSLRLRTLDRSIVSLPNAKVAGVELENFSLRDQFWFHQVFTLNFDTPHQVVDTILQEITGLLEKRTDLDQGTRRARLIALSPAGPQLEISAYVLNLGTDTAAFLTVQQAMILQIMSIVETAGASLAEPAALLRIEPNKSSPEVKGKN